MLVLMRTLIGQQMLYVDGTVCNGFNVGRKRPPTTFWTYELLREREAVELDSGGFGNGELEGPYVEADYETMPDNEEVWFHTMHNDEEEI